MHEGWFRDEVVTNTGADKSYHRPGRNLRPEVWISMIDIFWLTEATDDQLQFVYSKDSDAKSIEGYL